MWVALSYPIGVISIIFIFECIYHALGEKEIHKLERNDFFIDHEFRTTQFTQAFLWPLFAVTYAVWGAFKLLSLTAKGLVKGGGWFVCAVIKSWKESSKRVKNAKAARVKKIVSLAQPQEDDDWHPQDFTGRHKEKNA